MNLHQNSGAEFFAPDQPISGFMNRSKDWSVKRENPGSNWKNDLGSSNRDLLRLGILWRKGSRSGFFNTRDSLKD